MKDKFIQNPETFDAEQEWKEEEWESILKQMEDMAYNAWDADEACSPYYREMK